MKADGTIIINTKIDTDGIEDLNKELKDTSKQSKKAGDGLGGAFKKIFSASALADIAVGALRSVEEALKNLTIESIEAAADIQAENAQFSETFKELEETATDSLNSISDDVGITASRMKKSYTKVFAFTKSVGAKSEKAMDIANRAMRAAADSAAYYDKSVEEATETLQSFLKGNYENDAALGIAATETTRNAKANELYAMSFDKLSESQKVDVLLAMVEAGNEASGALGQASREADAWTNVQGELNEAWRQLLGAFGDPILDTITPLLQGISKAIYSIIEVSDSRKLKNSFKDFSKAVEEANSIFSKTAQDVESAAYMAGFYAERLEELQEAGLDTAAANKEYQLTVQKLNELIPELNLSINEETGLINTGTLALKANIKAWQEQATAKALQEKFADILEAQAKAEADLLVAEAKLNTLHTERTAIETRLAEKTEESRQITEKLAAMQEKLRSAESLTAEETERLAQEWEQLSAQGVAVTDELMVLSGALQDTKDAQSDLNKEYEAGREKLESYSGEMTEARDAMALFDQKATESALNISAGQVSVYDAISQTKDTVQSLKEEYGAAKITARESIDAQIGYFDKLSLSSDRTAGDIIENWQAQQTAFDNYAANLQKAVDMGLDESLVEQLSDGSTQSMEILSALVNDTDVNIDEINAAFSKVSQSRDTVAATMADVETDMSDRLDAMAADVEREWGDMAVEVGEEIANMQRYIDSLSGKTVYVDVIQRTKESGSSSSGGISREVPYSTTGYAIENAVASASYDVPYLAKGTVIPPNAPFMAVLGDQKHGTNVEAPLSTIQEAVALVMEDYAASNLAGHEATVAVLREILEAILGIEIGDDIIGQAVARYNHKMAVARGG